MYSAAWEPIQLFGEYLLFDSCGIVLDAALFTRAKAQAQ